MRESGKINILLEQNTAKGESDIESLLILRTNLFQTLIRFHFCPCLSSRHTEIRSSDYVHVHCSVSLPRLQMKRNAGSRVKPQLLARTEVRVAAGRCHSTPKVLPTLNVSLLGSSHLFSLVFSTVIRHSPSGQRAVRTRQK